MLGLGDIVIPGIFVALSLKFDVDRHLTTKGTITNIPTPYFNSCFLGYVAGIVTTFAAMTVIIYEIFVNRFSIMLNLLFYSLFQDVVELF